MIKIILSLALRKRKTLKSRIEAAIRSGVFVSVTKGAAEKPTLRQFSTKEKLDVRLQADFQSVNDMINEYHKLVAAIVVSNANTTVTIAGNEYTVADAIERRNSLRMSKQFHERLKQQFVVVIREVDSSTSDIDRMVNSFVTANKSDNMDADGIKELTNQTHDRITGQHLVSICDPNDLTNRLDLITKDLTDYEDELETALNIINARTELEY